MFHVVEFLFICFRLYIKFISQSLKLEILSRCCTKPTHDDCTSSAKPTSHCEELPANTWSSLAQLTYSLAGNTPETIELYKVVL